MLKNNFIQYLDRAEIERMQIQKLKEEFKYFLRSPYYNRLFLEHNINFNGIKYISDLQSFPTTTKKDIQSHNSEFIAVPRSRIIDYVTTSGTLGDPIIIALTSLDLQRLAYNEYLSFSVAGINSMDTIQLMTTIDRRFMAGLAYLLGARKMRSSLIRVGNGNPALQWDTVTRLNPNVCIAVPSFLARLIDYLGEENINPNLFSLKKALCIGEAIRTDEFELNSLSSKILNSWENLSLFSTYASSEMQTTFTECEAKLGVHHQPELCIVEFLDNDNCQVPSGEIGEVTITTMGVRGLPLFRFKTGDMCRHYSDKCKCGRTTTRLGPIIGRKDQLIKYKGTSLYPSTLFNVLDACPFVKNYIVIISPSLLGPDLIAVHIAGNHIVDSDIQYLKFLLQSSARVTPDIIIDSIDNIISMQTDMFDRKLKKVLDLRPSHF